MSLKISEEEYKRRLEEAIINLEKYLNISKYYNSEELLNYYIKIKTYLKTRIGITSFSKNLLDKVILLKELTFSEEDILKMIYNFPSLLHMDKKDILIKYLLLGKVVDSNTGECDRYDIMVNHTKDLMCGKETLYARIMYFLNFENSNIRSETITRRKVLKNTSSEFFNSYGMNKDELLTVFPFNEQAFKLICNWDENTELIKLLTKFGMELK